MRRQNKWGSEHVRCVKRAKPCKDVAVLTDEPVMRIARLASLRMWDAYKDAERRALDAEKTRAVVVLDGLCRQIELPDEWEWSPRINADGSRILAEDSAEETQS
jgi:hypothetical protein